MCPGYLVLHQFIGLHGLGAYILPDVVIGALCDLSLILVRSLFRNEQTGSERLNNFSELIPDKH